MLGAVIDAIPENIRAAPNKAMEPYVTDVPNTVNAVADSAKPEPAPAAAPPADAAPAAPAAAGAAAPYERTTAAITNKEEVEKQNTYKQNIKIINDKSIRLKEVVVKADKKTKTEKLNNELSSGMFNNINETVIDFVNESQPIEGYTNIMDFLAGRVAGLTVSNGVPKIRNSEVAIYWNEMKMTSDNLTSINPRDIAMVKIFKGAGLLGNAIAIYSKRGSDAPVDNTPMLPNNLIQIGGYNQSLPYFSNDDYESLYNDIPNDIRSTLFWNPNLYTAPGENTEIEYFNNDKPKDYQLTIIGFDEKGNPVYYEGKIN